MREFTPNRRSTRALAREPTKAEILRDLPGVEIDKVAYKVLATPGHEGQIHPMTDPKARTMTRPPAKSPTPSASLPATLTCPTTRRTRLGGLQMRYALLLYGTADEDAEPDGSRPEWEAYFEATREAGVFVTAQGLDSVETATTVRTSAGETLLTDGPFAETTEHLLGFYLIDTPDLDTAIRWASRMPITDRGSVEIRPLKDRLTHRPDRYS
ncbi:YciI family protein [Actinomadura napierensis]|uniref:YCII-related domain-containing protein n=1 Tax=Actinomadura napierensis TaxID=267854 RepID=A0ABN3A2V8_9ACTN